MFIVYVAGNSARYITNGTYRFTIPNNTVLTEWKALLPQVMGHSQFGVEHAISASMLSRLLDPLAGH